ncbi:MAG: DUF3375 domain-containing protein [Synergistaceae bacterium]|jgi:hypothetical protein|nr:DUF3375 domain-containing protein [Synergistaceae bacterium]
MLELDYEILSELKRNNAAWRLLTADMAPLVISFLNRAFIVPNVRAITESDLAMKLDDELYDLRAVHGDDSFRRRGLQYVREWAEPDKAWLRRFQVRNSDEAHYDVTPSAEKAISWADSLMDGSFIGTESRLKTAFDLLRQIVHGAEADPELRLAELKRRRDELDAEITRVERGEISLLDNAAIRDRFQQFSFTARQLLSDFRSVEQNFRELDRDVRRRIALWREGRGALLDEILGEHDAIIDSDQGRSFFAFYDFLRSPSLQTEFNDLVEKVMRMPATGGAARDDGLMRIHHLWVDASSHVQDIVAALSAQLRRFLDNRVWLENRRIVELFEKIQEHALECRSNPPSGTFMEMGEASVGVRLMMERPMYSPRAKTVIDSDDVVNGDESFDVSALFDGSYVDRSILEGRVDRALMHAPEITLGELLAAYPPERGLAEVLTYLSIAASRNSSIFRDGETDFVAWRNESGKMTEAEAPRLIFTREYKKA